MDLGQREWPADPNEHTERGVAKRSAMKRESPGWRHRCDWRRATDSRPTNPRVDVAGVRRPEDVAKRLERAANLHQLVGRLGLVGDDVLGAPDKTLAFGHELGAPVE